MNVLQVGKDVNKWLALLSARQVFPFGMGDEHVANSKHGGKDNNSNNNNNNKNFICTLN